MLPSDSMTTMPDGLRKSDFWFTDGNVVLVARGISFKVHRGQLERHSEIFRDLFSIPQPAEQQLIDSCPWVELHDDPTDVLHLLSALYDGLYFTASSATNFHAIAGVLRLSSKYLIEHLRSRCLTRLYTDWPSTLEGWDLREKEALDSIGRYLPRECFPHPILVINLANELGLTKLLPAALYDLSRYGPRKIVSGTTTPLPMFLAPKCQSLSLDSQATHESTRIYLSQQQLYTTLLGREAGQRYIATFIDKELSVRQISDDCTNRLHDSGRTCRESFYFIMLNILRSVGGISCGRDADPLYTLVQAVDMLSRTDFSDGVKQCGLKICGACKVDFAQSVAKAREEVWVQIPVWFALKSPTPVVTGKEP